MPDFSQIIILIQMSNNIAVLNPAGNSPFLLEMCQALLGIFLDAF